jgi:hypothetical protein
VLPRTKIFSERHLRTVLAEYGAHYNGRRPHRGRQLNPPRPDHPIPNLNHERIKRRPVLGTGRPLARCLQGRSFSNGLRPTVDSDRPAARRSRK